VKTIRWSQRRKQRNYNVRVDPRPATARSISRYLTELSATAASYYAMSVPVVSSDFYAKISFYKTSYTWGCLISGPNLYIMVVGTSDAIAYGKISVLTSAGTRFSDNRLTLNAINKLSVSISGTTLTINLNGVVTSYSGLAVPNFIAVTRIGRSDTSGTIGVGADNFAGIIFGVTVASAGVPLLDLPLDAPIPASQIIPNNAYGNPGAPEFVTAVNLTSAASYLYILEDNGWNNQFWPNLLKGSDLFTTGWSYSATSGGYYAHALYTLVEVFGSNGAASSGINQPVTPPIGGLTISVYVRKSTSPLTRIGLYSNTASWYFYADFAFVGDVPTIVNLYGSNAVFSAELQSDGIYRVVLSGVKLTAENDARVHFHPDRYGTGLGVYAGHIQLETGLNATDYVATTTTIGQRLEVA
jgi:hypothetical protein